MADGGSRDGTARDRARAGRARWCRAAGGRAGQLNAGAARGRAATLLLFLHADSRLPAGAYGSLRGAADPGVGRRQLRAALRRGRPLRPRARRARTRSSGASASTTATRRSGCGGRRVRPRSAATASCRSWTTTTSCAASSAGPDRVPARAGDDARRGRWRAVAGMPRTVLTRGRDPAGCSWPASARARVAAACTAQREAGGSIGRHARLGWPHAAARAARVARPGPSTPTSPPRSRGAGRSCPRTCKTPNQMLGRRTAGCEGTHGVFPRCNLACTPCYHSREANRVRVDGEHTVREVDRQMALLRERRGPGQNAQLIGGEVTLLEPDDHAAALQAMIDHGRKPMSMSHGDFDYDYLEALALDPATGRAALHAPVLRRALRLDDVRPPRDQGAARRGRAAIRIARALLRDVPAPGARARRHALPGAQHDGDAARTSTRCRR